MAKYKLMSPGSRGSTPVSFPASSATEHSFEDHGNGWLLVVDEVGCRRQYVVTRDTLAVGDFEAVETFVGRRKMTLNLRYVVRREAVRIWEELTTHRYSPSPLRRVFVTHPDADLESAGRYVPGADARELFVEVDGRLVE